MAQLIYMINALILGLYEKDMEEDTNDYVDLEDCHGYEIIDPNKKHLDNPSFL